MATKTPEKSKAMKKMSLTEISKELAGKKKEVFVVLSETTGLVDKSYERATTLKLPKFLAQSPAEIAAFLIGKAEEAGLDPANVSLAFRRISVTKPRRRKKPGTGRYRGHTWVSATYEMRDATVMEGPYWVLVGYAPYSDAELEKIGEKLVEKKQKTEAKELERLQKKVDEFNRHARGLGQPTITVEDLRKQEGK